MFFERLREERNRLGLTQPVFAAQADAKKRTVIDWEKGVSSPTTVQLEALSKIGVDVQYVVTGQRSGEALPDDVSELVALYQKAPLAVKAAVLRALAGDASESVGVNVRGSNNQIAGRDFNGSK